MQQKNQYPGDVHQAVGRAWAAAAPRTARPRAKIDAT